MDEIGLNGLYRTKLDQIRLNRINVDCIGPKGKNGIKVDKIDRIGLKWTNVPNRTEVDQSRQNGLNGTK